MTTLRAQIALEFWMLRPYARQFALLLGLGCLFTLVMATVTPLMMTMALLTGAWGFSIVERANLETLFATLPSPRRNVVLARYGVATATLLAAGVVGMAIDAIAASVQRQPWSPASAGLVFAVSFAIAAFVTSVQFPFYFALGYTRARIVSVVAIGVVSALLGAIVMQATGLFDLDLFADAAGVVGTPATLITVGELLTGFVMLAASTALSIRIYSRKDL